MASSPPNNTGGGGGGHSVVSTTTSNANVKNNNNVKLCGYLRKQKHGHKRFFVLKEPGEGFPSARLEYYESEKKWRNKSAAPKRVIPLDCCLNINKRADAKHRYLIALYTKDEYFAVAAENETEQENWYGVLTDLMSEGKQQAAAGVYNNDGGGGSGSSSAASNSASSLVGFGFDESSYGMITPVAAAYKEVWQVNLKSKGLGQSRNLTGVYRLCLSSRTISFVKLNTEVASVSLQLMNIRRCGHSDSFFFIEVGRSAATGPGELWMQADDSVVAQNIHETILEGMKAMKEQLSEFRPRSKSQSSGCTNPISVPHAGPARRHVNNRPPRETGLPTRRSRTESMAATATSPVSKFTSCRIRAASEGDGTMTRPMSVNRSPLSPGGVHRTLLTRSNTITARPVCRTFECSSLQHSKSMSMPVSSHSPPLATTPSPVSLSSCPESSAPLRSSSCSASFSGSPSDLGFISCDEYSSSPAEARDLRLTLTLRSNTPESLNADTPPSSQDGSDLHGYMVMERLQNQNGYHRRLPELDKAYRKRTYSLTTPRQQRVVPSQVSSASLDEYTLMKATYNTSGSQSSRARSHTASPKATYPEDYGDVEIGSNCQQQQGDNSGYMPMMPGVLTQTAAWTKGDAYMPMSPMCVSAPKQIINPLTRSSHPFPSPAGPTGPTRTATDSPGSSVSLEDSGYMRMWCGAKMSVESADGKLANGEYLNMSPVDPLISSLTPPHTDCLHNSPLILGDPPHHRQPYTYSSLPRSLKAHQAQRSSSGPPQTTTDTDQYVVMSLQRQRIEEESNYCPVSSPGSGKSVSSGSSPRGSPAGTPSSSSAPSPLRMEMGGGGGGLVHRANRANQPTRLALESLRTLPCMSEHPLPSEPRSPGEYINIDFSKNATTRYPPPTSVATECPDSSSLSVCATVVQGGSPPAPLSDYVNVKVGGSPSSSSAGLLNHTLGAPGTRPSLQPDAQQQDNTHGVVGEGQEKRSTEGRQEKEEEERRVMAKEGYLLQRQVSPGMCSSGGPVKDDYTEMTFSPLPLAPLPLPTLCATIDSPTACVERLSLEAGDLLVGVSVPPALLPVESSSFLLGVGPSLSIPGGGAAVVDPDRGAKVIRADPQGRRRHSSETFSSTTTVTPVCPSFAHDNAHKQRHSSASVENVSRPNARSDRDGGGSAADEEYGSVSGASPMCRETSAGYQNGLNYIALNLMEGSLGVGGCGSLGGCEGLLRFKTTPCGCKPGGMNGFNASPYASMGFKETATAVKD